MPDVIGQTIGGMIADGIARSRGVAPAGRGGAMAAQGATEQTIDSDALAWMNGGAPISAEQAAAASAAIQGAFPQGSGGTDLGGFGLHGYVFGSDPLTAWLGSEYLKEGRAADFDDYVGKWGRTDAVGGLLYSEANGVASGQLSNQFIMLGYLSGQGSQTAAAVARSLYSQTPEAAIQVGLGLPSSSLTRSYDLGTLLAVSYAVPTPHYDVSNGYAFTNAPAPLNGWQRAGAAINGVGHGVVAGLLGFGAIGTSPLIGTGLGTVVPVGLGLGAGFEGDNAFTNLKMAWTGQRQSTLGASLITDTFGVSPNSAEMIYTGVQIATAAGTGVAGTKLLTVPIPNGRAFQDFSPDAIALRNSVAAGGTVYRGGTLGLSRGPEAQFWAPEAPWSSGYASRYGIPPQNMAAMDMVSIGTVPNGGRFVTRIAPGVGSNTGGALEIVTSPYGVRHSYFGGW